MKKAGSLIILSLFLFCACSTGEQVMDMAGQNLPKNMTVEKKDRYRVWITEQWNETGKYEPEGCYLGAAVTEDQTVDGDFRIFEETIGAEHQIYAKQLRLGEPYPLQWVLECYAAGKIPFMSLYPAQGYTFFDMEDVSVMAEEFGTLHIPIFLQLYPNPSSYGVPAEQYITQFKAVTEVFRQEAPNVSLVWSVNWRETETDIRFYPGEQAVDWIGIDIYGQGTEKEKILRALEYFYFYYQKEKPLLISQLGISHYSTNGHQYQTEEAADCIAAIYQKLSDYPRIKGVIYMDYNAARDMPAKAVREDYTITGITEMLNAYRSGIENSYFQANAGNYPDSRRIVSPFWGYLQKGNLYLSEKTLRYDLQKYPVGEPVFIEGQKYYLYMEDYQVKGNKIFLEKEETLETAEE